MHRPLTQFLILGLALFAASRWWSDGRPAENVQGPEQTIVISETRVDRLTDAWTVRYGAAPSPFERQAIVDAEINDEVLHREALRLGIHRMDPVVEHRLTQNMRFLTEADAATSDAELLGDAFELDMVATDAVVRRRLIQQMQSMLEAAAAPPSAEESRDFVRRHPDRFSTAARFEITYRFESTTGDGAIEGRTHSGDFSAKTLSRDFGSGGAEQIEALAPGEWSGPIHRSGGIYHVRLDGVVPARPIEFGLVRGRAHHALLQARRQEALQDALRLLRSRYRVRVDGSVSPAS